MTKSTHSFSLRILGTALFLAALSSAASAADLKLTVENLRSSEGTVYIAVYNSAETFPKDGKSVAGQYIPVTDTTANAVFIGLKPGRYAVSVFHDENGNGHLDTNLLGVPVERYGFSNNASGSFGPPSFDAAAVDLSGDQAITIKLR